MRRYRKFLPLTLLACFITPDIVLSAEPTWREKTLKDLQTIRDTLKSNHPGFKTNRDLPEKDFLAWFETGNRIAKRRAEKTDSLFGYYFTLRAYGIGFQDEHLAVQVASFDRFKEQMKFRWPGFSVQLTTTNQITVSSVDPTTQKEAPPIGATLLSCDGRKPEKLLNENVYPFYGDKRILKNRIIFAPRIFVDSGNPFVQLPGKCLFEMNGKRMSHTIRWAPISFDDLWPRIDVSYNLSRPTGTKTLDGDTHWVSLPTFSPDSQTEQSLKGIISSANSHRGHKALVFDLRGNGGGSSTWGVDVLKGYFGEGYIDGIQSRSRRTTNETFEYRVSRENLKYFEGLLGNSSKNVSTSDKFFGRVVTEMRSALGAGKEIISIKLSDFDSVAAEIPEIQLKGKTVVLTDMYCASACLSVLDTIRLIPGVVHVGQETSADAVFMQTTTPSKLSDPMIQLSFPVLRIRNRPRGNNSSVMPTIQYQGDISNSEQIEQWVSKTVLGVSDTSTSANAVLRSELVLPYKREMESEKVLPTPYVVSFSKGTKALQYVLARHVETVGLSNPPEQDATLKTITDLFKNSKIDGVIVEGMEPWEGFTLPANIQSKVLSCRGKQFREDCGESFYALSLGEEAGAKLASGEPSQKEILSAVLKSGLTEEDLLGFYAVRQIPQWKRDGSWNSQKHETLLAERLNRDWRRIGAQREMTFENFEKWYSVHMLNGPAYKDVTVNDASPRDDKAATHIQKISHQVDLVRNRAIVNRISYLLQNAQNILVVYGGSHYPPQEPAFLEYFGKNAKQIKKLH